MEVHIDFRLVCAGDLDDRHFALLYPHAVIILEGNGQRRLVLVVKPVLLPLPATRLILVHLSQIIRKIERSVDIVVVPTLVHIADGIAVVTRSIPAGIYSGMLLHIHAFEEETACPIKGVGLLRRSGLRALAGDFDGHRVLRRYHPLTFAIGQSPGDLRRCRGVCVIVAILCNSSCSLQLNGASVGRIANRLRSADSNLSTIIELGHCIFSRSMSAVSRRALDLDLQGLEQVVAGLRNAGLRVCLFRAAGVRMRAAGNGAVTVAVLRMHADLIIITEAVAVVVLMLVLFPDRIDGHDRIVLGQRDLIAAMVLRLGSVCRVSPAKMCVALTAGQRLAVDLVRVASFRCGTIFNVPLGAPSPGVVKIVVQMVGVLGLRLFFVFAAVKTILDVLAVLAEGAVALFVLGMQTSLALIADAILIAVYVIFRRRLAAVTLTGVGAIAVVFPVLVIVVMRQLLRAANVNTGRCAA